MKSLLRGVLEKCVNRHRFNDSWAYGAYLELAYPNVAKARKAEKEFYHGLLGTDQAGLIFDVGANHGAKAAIFAQLASKVVCVEADPAAVDVLRQRFAWNKGVEIVGRAAGARQEMRKLHRFADGGPYNTLSEKWVGELADRTDASPHRPRMIEESATDVEVTTLDALIKRYGIPDYIKIDVEGYELEVVNGLSASQSIVSVECNLPVFKSETLSIIETLASRAPDGVFNYTMTEPPVGFASVDWLPKDRIAGLVSKADFQFMEIYFKPHPHAPN